MCCQLEYKTRLQVDSWLCSIWQRKWWITINVWIIVKFVGYLNRWHRDVVGIVRDVVGIVVLRASCSWCGQQAPHNFGHKYPVVIVIVLYNTNLSLSVEILSLQKSGNKIQDLSNWWDPTFSLLVCVVELQISFCTHNCLFGCTTISLAHKLSMPGELVWMGCVRKSSSTELCLLWLYTTVGLYARSHRSALY